MSLSAPYICEIFKDKLIDIVPYIDLLFGNNTVSYKKDSSLMSLRYESTVDLDLRFPPIGSCPAQSAFMC